jgi:tetratricopeptide (TPR) repeat protein
VQALEAMRRDWPGDRRVLERLVEIEDSLLRVKEVVPRLEALLAQSPRDARTVQRLADHYRWFGNLQGLITMLHRLNQLGDYPEARYELVDILLAQRRYDELIGLFTRDLDKMANPVETRVALYEAYQRAGQVDRAVNQLRRIVDESPRRLDYLRQLGDTLIALDRMDEALALYQKKYDEQPGNVELQRELASLYESAAADAEEEGQRDRALALLRRRIAVIPDDLSARLDYADLHRPEPVANKVAARELRDLLRRRPANAGAWTALGDRLSWLGDLAGAATAYERALALGPDNERARRGLAEHLSWLERPREALPHYRLLARRGDRDDRVRLVELLLDSEQVAEASTEARRLVADDPRPAHRRLLAAAASAAGDCETALREYRELTRRNPGDVEAWTGRRSCATELGLDEEIELSLQRLARLKGRGGGRKR